MGFTGSQHCQYALQENYDSHSEQKKLKLEETSGEKIERDSSSSDGQLFQ